MSDYDFKPGIYQVENSDGLNVRSSAHALNNNNLIGYRLTVGKRFPVYRTVTNERGEVWAIISPPNVPVNQTHYVCLWNINALFAVPLIQEVESLNETLDELDRKIGKLDNRVTALEERR